jgi:hypothetical protein
MKVITLLEQLFGHSNVTTSNISSEAKGCIHLMRNEAEKLKSSTDPEKQRKMIALFIGGTILSLHKDDCKYHYPFKLYDGTAIDRTWKKLDSQGIKSIGNVPYMYEIGYAVLEDLSNDFSNLFAKEYQLIGTTGNPPVPFFPGLKQNLEKVNQLVKFCIEHKDNLEVPEFESGTEQEPEPQHKSPPVSPPHDAEPPPPEFKDFVTEFAQRHEKSYKSGFLGGFFNRTNLEKYEDLTPQKILDHAKQHTFFGFKNRTCKILEDMKVLDEKGELLQKSVHNNQVK